MLEVYEVSTDVYGRRWTDLPTIPSNELLPTLSSSSTAGQVLEVYEVSSGVYGRRWTDLPSLAIATTSVLGGIIVGSNLSIALDGTLTATNTEYTEGDGIDIDTTNSNAISIDLSPYSVASEIKLTSSTDDLILATTLNTKEIQLNNDGVTKFTVANGFNTSNKLRIEYDLDVQTYNSDDVNLLVTNVTTNGENSVVTIRGSRNGTTTEKTCQLRFENLDDNSSTPQIHTLGAISCVINNSTTNVGDLKFYTFSDGENEHETLKLASDGNATFGKGCTATDFTFNITGGTSTVSSLYANALTSVPEATSSAFGGVKLGFSTTGTNYAVELDTNKQAFVDVPDTAITVATTNALGGIKLGFSTTGTNYAVELDTNSKAYVDVPIPMATDTTLGGVIIDGGNLNINASGKLSATIVKKQTLSHVGVFNLQATTDLRTETDTLIRWKPAISMGSSGLLHDQDNAIPNGTLFYCNDGDGGVYNINVQIALTSGTPGRSFHVLELRTFTGGANQYTQGTASRTYFIGSGYARMLNGTNKCFYGGNIQITMEEHDQFQIVSTRKYVSGAGVLELNAGVDATRLIIDRLIIG